MSNSIFARKLSLPGPAATAGFEFGKMRNAASYRGWGEKRTVSGSTEYVPTNDWVCKGWSITLEFRSRQTIRYRRCKDLWELLVS